VRSHVLVLLYLLHSIVFHINDDRIVHDDGGDVLVNVVEPAERGRVNVINGLENVMLISADHAMRRRSWTPLILPRNVMGRYMKGDVPMFVFNVVYRRGL
jgi:hypothetical protein